MHITAIIVLAVASQLESPAFRLTAKPGSQHVLEVVNFTAKPYQDWPSKLKVITGDGTPEQRAARVPMLGIYTYEKGTLRFVPRFPFSVGVNYLAIWTGENRREFAFSIQKPVVVRSRVVAIYPSGDKLPENMLRMYLHFSQSMSRGDAFNRIRLYCDTDKKFVEMPFLELDEELWSPDRKRFTLLFDPGRIKREVKPREDLGPALEAGKSFTLIVDPKWEDANGTPLAEGYHKTFAVVAADRQAIDPLKWKITGPNEAGTLTVSLGKPHDSALLQRLVWVEDSIGEKCAGDITLSSHQSVWSFQPKRPWLHGHYRLVVDHRLEDPCGNRVHEPFETDLTKTDSPKPITVVRKFTVK